MRSLLCFALASIAAACSPYDPDLGPSPFKCGPSDQSPRCPDGYTCQGEYCLAPSGSAPVDSSSGCPDEGLIEPNETYMNAFQTSVATSKASQTFSGLAICPQSDKDHFAITTTMANQNLEVLIELDAAGAELGGAILNSMGTSIMTATAEAGEMGKRRAYVANLPAGVYYASVYGPGTGTNNYKLTINVTGP